MDMKPNSDSDFFEKIARFGFADVIDVTGELETSESAVYRCFIGQNRLKTICLQFYRDVQDIRSDQKLTAEGHADKIKVFARAALLEVDKAEETFLAVGKKKLESLQGEFKTASALDTPERVLREIELRGMIRELDASARWQILKEAIEEQNELMFLAFVNAPKFLRLVNEQILSQCKQAWTEKLNPRTAKLLNTLETAFAILTKNFGMVREGIGRLGMIFDDSMRARLQKLPAVALAEAQRIRDDPNKLAHGSFDTAGNPLPDKYNHI